MDPDALRMLEDLGVARRETVSAPQADAKGRPTTFDPRAAREIREADEARRQRILEGAPAAEKDSDKTLKLGAWNSINIFAEDSHNPGLQNLFSGQGHRAQLSAALSAQHNAFDQRREATEARLGEERQLYLQTRATTRATNNYVVTASPTRGPTPIHNVNSTPRSFQGGAPNVQTPTRGRVASIAAPRPNRAPSPRASGVVRFVGGRRIEQQNAASRPRPNVPDFQSAVRPTTPSRPTARTAQPSSSSTPGSAASAHGMTLRTSPNHRVTSPVALHGDGVQRASSSTSTSATLPPATQSCVASAGAALRVLPSTIQSASAASSSSAPRNPPPATQPLVAPGPAAVHARSNAVAPPPRKLPAATNRSVAPANSSGLTREMMQQYCNEAVYYATRPGPDCEAYYNNHPDQRRILKHIQKDMVKKAIDLSREANAHQTTAYLAMEQAGTRWIYGEVLKAKAMVEEGRINDLEARFAKVSDIDDLICRGAKRFFGRKQEAEPAIRPPAESAASITDTTAPPASTSPAAREAAGLRIMPGTFPQETQNVPQETQNVPEEKQAVLQRSQDESVINEDEVSAMSHNVAGNEPDPRSWLVKIAAELHSIVEAAVNGMAMSEVIAAVEAIAASLVNLEDAGAELLTRSGVQQGQGIGRSGVGRVVGFAPGEDGLYEDDY